MQNNLDSLRESMIYIVIMTMWVPDLAARPGPRYRALVDALS
jgi:hypothetical protein